MADLAFDIAKSVRTLRNEAYGVFRTWQRELDRRLGQPSVTETGLGARTHIIASVADMFPLSSCPVVDESVDPETLALIDDCSGVEPQLLKMIAGKMNMTVKFKQLGDGPWGSLMPNGSWNGHIGRILRGDVDLAIGSITHTFARYKAVDFTSQVSEDYYTFTVPSEFQLPNYDAFFKPFNPATWIVIIVSMILIAIVQTVFDRWIQNVEPSFSAPKDDLIKNWGQGNAYKPGWLLSILETVSSEVKTKVSPFARIRAPFGALSYAALLGSWVVAMTVLEQIYSAVILAFLITPAFPRGIRTLEDGVLRSQAAFVTTKMDGALTEYISQNAAEPGSLFKSILDQKRLVVCTNDRLNCGRLGRDFIFCPADLAERYKANFTYQGLRLNLAEEHFLVSSLSWPIRKGSLLTPKLNRFISWAHAGGITKELLKQEKKKYATMFKAVSPDKLPMSTFMAESASGQRGPRSEQNTKLNLDGMETLSFEEFKGAFVLYAAGLFLAFTSFVAELAHHWRSPFSSLKS